MLEPSSPLAMTRRQACGLALQTAAPLFRKAPRKLLVISVDGLDHRYLRDADRLGLHIPTLRRLRKEGLLADEVVGEVPTVTWPSHTTMVTGVPPRVHGIRSNRRPPSEGGDYYWSLDLCKTPTLWHTAREQRLKTAAITWPVTVTSIIDCNLPEFFQRRRGGAMDLRSIASVATAGLVEKIARAHPSFAQEWMDDRTRTLAALYILQNERPDFFAVHLVDLDSEQHDNGPFTREACAVLEYTDELLARLFDALPDGYAVALVSDHGFSPVRRLVHLRVLMQRERLAGSVELTAGLALAKDSQSAEALETLARNPGAGIGRRVPVSELIRFAPELRDYTAAYEPAEGVLFGGAASGAAEIAFAGRGEHGFWPGRPDYRACLLLWGPGISPGRIPEAALTGHAKIFAELLGISFSIG